MEVLLSYVFRDETVKTFHSCSMESVVFKGYFCFFYVALYLNYILFKFKFGGGRRKCSVKLCCSACRAVRADQVHLNVWPLHRSGSEFGLSQKGQ